MARGLMAGGTMGGGVMARVVAAREAVEGQDLAAEEGLAQATATATRGAAVVAVAPRAAPMEATAR